VKQPVANQTFFVKPFFNLNDKEFPADSIVDMPRGATLRVHQYFNFVFFQIYTPVAEVVDMTSRSVRMITEQQAVPADWALVGSVILNEANTSGSDTVLGDNDEEDSDLIDIPTDPDEFYRLLTIANVYLSPELPDKKEFSSWRFGR
jgi:hypothetical protein